MRHPGGTTWWNPGVSTGRESGGAETQTLWDEALTGSGSEGGDRLPKKENPTSDLTTETSVRPDSHLGPNR